MIYKKLRQYKYEILKDIEIKLPYSFGYYSGEVKRNKKKAIVVIYDGKLYIKKGFRYDGPSGPTCDTPNSMFAAVIHDALYLLMRESIIPRELQKETDVLFRKLLIANGMNKIRAWFWYRGVRRFGHLSTEKNSYKCTEKTK